MRLGTDRVRTRWVSLPWRQMKRVVLFSRDTLVTFRRTRFSYFDAGTRSTKSENINKDASLRVI